MVDLISRSALLEAYDRQHEGEAGRARKLIAEAPAVDAVEVKHGRWIMRGGKRYCSACGQKACVTRDSEDFWYTVGTDYCPKCGAKMDGERKENETD